MCNVEYVRLVQECFSDLDIDIELDIDMAET